MKRTTSPDGNVYSGGCHWDYFQADCNNPLIAYYLPKTSQIDANAIGPTSRSDPRDSRFQLRPAADRCDPCRASTAHAAMNACMADGSIRQLTGEMSRFAWWALVTPAGHDIAE